MVYTSKTKEKNLELKLWNLAENKRSEDQQCISECGKPVAFEKSLG